MLLVAISIFLLFLSAVSGFPVVAIGLGIAFSLISDLDENFYTRKIGVWFLQLGVILIGLSINVFDAITVTKTYFPFISIFVLCTFFGGLLIGWLLGIDRRFAILISSGTAICGGTAMAAITPVIKAKPRDLAAGITVIFLLNAAAIIFFPILGKSLDLEQIQFGAWVATAIHDTSAVLATSLDYGSEAIETAATLKVVRTLWLLPLMIFLLFLMGSREKKIPVPFFVLFFALAIIFGSLVSIPLEKTIIRQVSQIFLMFGFFSIGTQISREGMKSFTLERLGFAIFLWALAIPLSYFLLGVSV
ncbi:MAG: hypothetical protein CMQ40_06335 [Gammaproteobacteria bacterium]|nr:hypothetical protein [Gammaproteobacteria bacterium]